MQLSDARARLIVLGICAVLLAAVLTVLASRTDDRGPVVGTPVAEECTDVLMVLVPGNGEGITSERVYAGRTLGIFRDRYRDRGRAGNRSVDVRVVQFRSEPLSQLFPPRRDHLPVNRAITSWRVSKWDPRMDAAVRETVDLLFQRQRACPHQSIVLAGYAQGAGVVHRTLRKFSSSSRVMRRIVGATLISDPDRVPGTDAKLMGRVPASRQALGIERARRESYADVPRNGTYNRVQSLCRWGDLVCDFRDQSVRHGLNMAGSYARYNADQIDLAAADLFRRTRAVAKPTPADLAVTGTVGMPLAKQLTADTRAVFADHLRWRATSQLPPGLALSARGLLSGQPTSAGSWTIHYTVSDTVHPAHSRPVPGTIRLTVEPSKLTVHTVGGDSTCAVKSDRTMWCWGDNYEGQLGQGNRVNQEDPVRMGSGDYWVTAATGGGHTCAIRTSGSLWCFGRGDFGQIGDRYRERRLRPVKVGDDLRWSAVSTNIFNSCAITRDAALYCWGKNDEGQIGNGTTTTRAQPIRVGTANNWVSVSVGAWHTCAIRRDGSAWCWGSNDFGQLGNGRDTIDRSGPVRVAGDLTWTDISAGAMHTCGILANGDAKCWGANTSGQLGDGTHDLSIAPVTVTARWRWTDIAVGTLSSCGVSGGGVVRCWGSGHTGVLGTDDVLSSDAPRDIESRARFVRVEIGWGHACAVQASSYTTCWGLNTAGQIGDGTHQTRPIPVRVLPG